MKPMFVVQGQFCGKARVLSPARQNTPLLCLPRVRSGDLSTQSLAPSPLVESHLTTAHFFPPAIEKGAIGLAPDRKTWPGFPAGSQQPVCRAVAACLPGNCAKGMEVMAPPASRRPASSKAEGEAEGDVWAQGRSWCASWDARALGCLAH